MNGYVLVYMCGEGIYVCVICACGYVPEWGWACPDWTPRPGLMVVMKQLMWERATEFRGSYPIFPTPTISPAPAVLHLYCLSLHNKLPQTW